MSLDRNLYAWLSEVDDRRFDRLFAQYYTAAFPSLVRFLKRRTARDEADLCDIAQETLLSFFQRIGQHRRQAFETLAQLAPGILPLPLGPFHESTVRSWRTDVIGFRQESIDKPMPAAGTAEFVEWKQRLQQLCGRIPSLQRRGCMLIHDCEVQAIRPFIENEKFPRMDDFASSKVGDDSDEPLHVGLSFVEALLDHVGTEEATRTARHAVKSFPGVLTFLEDSGHVVLLLPKLRAPSSSYLYDIATSILLDTIKRESTQKRGGLARSSYSARSIQAQEDDQALEALYTWEPQDLEGSAEEATDVADPSDFVERIENVELLQRFVEFLHTPVADATAAYQAASQRGKATSEKRRLESLAHKFERLMSVLSLHGQDFTQEEIAEQLKISRNQVKYVLESVQGAYSRFTSRTLAQSASSSTEHTTHG
jgi:DNA-directed RNA polymerase specialized sigma24 family protein